MQFFFQITFLSFPAHEGLSVEYLETELIQLDDNIMKT